MDQPRSVPQMAARVALDGASRQRVVYRVRPLERAEAAHARASRARRLGHSNEERESSLLCAACGDARQGSAQLGGAPARLAHVAVVTTASRRRRKQARALAGAAGGPAGRRRSACRPKQEHRLAVDERAARAKPAERLHDARRARGPVVAKARHQADARAIHARCGSRRNSARAPMRRRWAGPP